MRDGAGSRARLWAAVTVALAAGATSARAETAAPLARMEMRAQTLEEQAKRSERVAREQTAIAYRLARRRQLGFVTDPNDRLADARAGDLALLAARRSANEALVLREEASRARQDRTNLLPAVAAARARSDDGDLVAPPKFLRPVRGEVVGVAGLRKDPVTGVDVRQDAVQLLGRMNEPVRAPGNGVVRRIEALPQGGFAVVTAHEGTWTSVISGLRDVAVRAGDPVQRGDSLGIAGRNLDGAVVVSVELWRGRSAIDPRRLLHHR